MRGIPIAGVSAPMLLAAGCGFISIGPVCDSMGNCNTGVRVDAVFCPDGGIAPNREACDDDDDHQLQDLFISFSSNVALSFLNDTGFVSLIVRDEAEQIIDVLHPVVGVIGNQLKWVDPHGLADWLSAATNPGEAYNLEISPVTSFDFYAPGHFDGQSVHILTELKVGSATLHSVNTSFTYHASDGPLHGLWNSIGWP